MIAGFTKLCYCLIKMKMKENNPQLRLYWETAKL